MFALQPQEAALQPPALHALDDLKRQNATLERLQGRLATAVALITETSAQVNDRGSQQRARWNKKRTRIAKGEEVEDPEERQEYENYEEKVDALTKKMDLSIRRVIDDKIWVEDLPAALDHVRRKAGDAARGTQSTQMTTQQTTQRTEDDMDVDDTPQQDDTGRLVPPDPSRAPTTLLDTAFSTNQTKWNSVSLTNRYSEKNDYVGWYRMVFDAKHPGENAPPMPHASLWFAEEEGRDASTVPRSSQGQRQQTGRGNARTTRNNATTPSDSESDIEIASERIRIKCPITLLPYKDPVASTKCPHAFEKSAIQEMFKHTSDYMPLTATEMTELSQISRPQERAKREREIRTPMVRCPECSVPLSEQDLRPDPVLLRKVNRILEKERRAEEVEQVDGIVDAEDDDDDDDDGPPRGTQRRNIVHLGSSPAANMKRHSGRFVKNERRSIARESLTVHDDDEDEDDDMY